MRVHCPPEPSIVKVANVQHLGSQAEGRLSKPTPTVVELVRASETVGEEPPSELALAAAASTDRAATVPAVNR